LFDAEVDLQIKTPRLQSSCSLYNAELQCRNNTFRYYVPICGPTWVLEGIPIVGRTVVAMVQLEVGFQATFDLLSF
jgi:hypothetical protein